MELEQQRLLQRYFDMGYSILIGQEPIFQMGTKSSEQFDLLDPEIFTDEEVLWETDDSDVYSLTQVSIAEVRVFVPIDWMGILSNSGYEMPKVLNMTHDLDNIDLNDYQDDLTNAYDEAGD